MMDKHDGEDRDITRHKEHVKQQTGKKGGQKGQRIPHQEGLRIPHLRCQKRHTRGWETSPHTCRPTFDRQVCVCVLFVLYLSMY